MLNVAVWTKIEWEWELITTNMAGKSTAAGHAGRRADVECAVQGIFLVLLKCR